MKKILFSLFAALFLIATSHVSAMGEQPVEEKIKHKSYVIDNVSDTIEFDGISYTVLEGDELTSIVDDVAILSDGGHFIEEFHRNGGYSKSGEFLPKSGTYNISGKLICMDISYPKNLGKQCASIYRSKGNDKYIKISIFDKDQKTFGKVSEIKVEKLTK